MFEGNERSPATTSGPVGDADDVTGASVQAKHARRMTRDIRRITVRVSHGCSIELMG
jgi:hypothetical protein